MLACVSNIICLILIISFVIKDAIQYRDFSEIFIIAQYSLSRLKVIHYRDYQIDWFGLCGLTSLPTIFQLYRGGQWWKPEYPEKTTDLSQVTDKLEVFITATIVRLSQNISSSIIFVPNGRNNDISNVMVFVPFGITVIESLFHKQHLLCYFL